MRVPVTPHTAGAQDWARQTRSARDGLDAVSAAALTLIYEHSATQAQVAAHLGLTEPQIADAVTEGLLRLAALLMPPEMQAGDDGVVLIQEA